MKWINKIISNCNHISKETVEKQIECIKKYILDEQWLSTILFDSAINPECAETICNYITFIGDNTDYLFFERILPQIRQQCEMQFEIASKEEHPVLRWYKYRYAYSLYAFIECITEGSLTTQLLVNSLICKYGNDYIKTICQVDKDALECAETKNDCEIKLYQLMKKWQEDQHYYHEKIAPKFYKAREDFEEYIRNEHYYESEKGNRLLLLFLLDNTPIIPLSLVLRFIQFNQHKNLIEVIGGKAFGLAQLLQLQVIIPLTYVIPVGSLKKELYKTEIDRLENIKYAVRSSATVEDGDRYSFAGVFSSILDVEKNMLAESIISVYKSLYTETAKAYTQTMQITPPHMAIMLQEFCISTLSGIWIGDSVETGYMEWVEGNGADFVSGKVTPKSMRWNSATQTSSIVNNIDIGKECIQIQKAMLLPLDFEWCITNNQLCFLQCRPVTKKPNIIDVKKHINENMYYGTPVSSGEITEKTSYVETIADCKHLDYKKHILITFYTDPNWIPIMQHCSGIITAEGGFLSHTAILARELDIPCITGVGKNTLIILKNAKKIRMNGGNGEICIIE